VLTTTTRLGSAGPVSRLRLAALLGVAESCVRMPSHGQSTSKRSAVFQPGGAGAISELFSAALHSAQLRANVKIGPNTEHETGASGRKCATALHAHVRN
jgi:hypothetical protein